MINTNTEDVTLRVVDIVDGTTVDGPGFRTSIYFAGCEHHCPGCQNPATWDPMAGKGMTIGELLQRIEENDFDVTFSGGDPLFQADPLALLAREIRKLGKTIWCYTGYLFETVQHDKRLSALLPFIDVMVDGPFAESQRDIELLFRGSSNQRLINVAETLASGHIVLWKSDF